VTDSSGSRPTELFHAGLAAEARRDPEAARAAFAALGELAEPAVDARVRAAALRRLADLDERAGEPARAETWLERAVDLLAPVDPPAASSARHELAAHRLRHARSHQAGELLLSDPLEHDAPLALLLGRCELVRVLLSEHASEDVAEHGAAALPLARRALALLEHPDPRLRENASMLFILAWAADQEAMPADELATAASTLLDALEGAGGGAGSVVPRSAFADLRRLAQRLIARRRFEPARKAWSLLRRASRRELGSDHPSSLAAAIGLARCLDGVGAGSRARRILRGVVVRTTRAASESATVRTDGSAASEPDRLAAIRRSALVYLAASLERSGSPVDRQEAARLASGAG
jgi:tetratricopeptide (TPR) repeat protein